MATHGWTGGATGMIQRLIHRAGIGVQACRDVIEVFDADLVGGHEPRAVRHRAVLSRTQCGSAS
jgi:hypothetical protein